MLEDLLKNSILPCVDEVNVWKLAENRVFYLDYDIDETVFEIQRAIINFNIEDSELDVDNRVPIKILIDSPGGNLDETMALASTITMSKTPVYTINVGIAYSGAGVILMAGHKRFAFPYSRALIHTGSGCLTGTFEQTETAQKNYKKQVDEMGKFILSHSSIDDKTYKKYKNQDWYLDSSEQIKYGITDEILTSLDIFE